MTGGVPEEWRNCEGVAEVIRNVASDVAEGVAEYVSNQL